MKSLYEGCRVPLLAALNNGYFPVVIMEFTKHHCQQENPQQGCLSSTDCAGTGPDLWPLLLLRVCVLDFCCPFVAALCTHHHMCEATIFNENFRQDVV